MQLTKEMLRQDKHDRHNYNDLVKTPCIFVLDGLQSSYNIGAIVRLADAFRVEKVIICENNSISNKRLKKVAKNMDRWVNIQYEESTVNTLEQLCLEDYQVTSVELCDDSVSINQAKYQSKVALVFGNEIEGVSDVVLTLSHQKVHIPMYGMGNSMNVSTAAAIVAADLVGKLDIHNE